MASATRKRSIDETFPEHTQTHDIKKLKPDHDDDDHNRHPRLIADSFSNHHDNDDTSTSSSWGTLSASNSDEDEVDEDNAAGSISPGSSLASGITTITANFNEAPSAALLRTPSSSSTSSSSSSSSCSSASDNTTTTDSNDEEEGTEAEEEPITVTLPRPPPIQRPEIRAPKLDNNANALLTQLTTFLPAIAVANEQLEEERVAGRLDERRLENVREGEGYIEMNLGLGVLEEKKRGGGGSEGDDDGTSGSSSDTDDDNEEDENGREGSGRGSTRRETDVLGRLMGRREAGSSKAGIEVVGDG